MYWKTKAKLQNAVSCLPKSLSYPAYYYLQRYFGGLRTNSHNPMAKFSDAIETWKKIKDEDVNPVGKTFLEIGTGRIPLAPLAYWLMGASEIITIDLNPYLKDKLIVESLKYLSDNEENVIQLFGSLLKGERFNKLLSFSKHSKFSRSSFLELCKVNYIAPGDASNTYLSNNYVDFHTSYSVFEHISSRDLKKILLEGNRIIKKTGIFIHRIDYSDHFSHSDTNINAINFLQYSDSEWSAYADNRYMYMNRLRHDDFINLFKSIGHCFIKIDPKIDEQLASLLQNNNVSLDSRFSLKPQDILATTSSWILSRKI